MMNLTADHMDARLKWCQSYKNQNWDFVIFSDETLFSDFRKSKKKWVQKGTAYRAPKTGKESIRSMHGQQYQEQKKPSLNYLLITLIQMLI